MRVEERFLKYAKVHTQSADGVAAIPSTSCQWDLARMLVEELHFLGVRDAGVDAHCYVTGTVPSNLPGGAEGTVLGLIAHMDTATESSGENVRPRIVKNYDGGTIVLNEDAGMTMDIQEFETLKDHIGEDLIVTDGTTLLGADDKAGIAAIMTMVEYLKEHPEILHGKLRIGFTPDEEVGRGPDAFDVEAFGAAFAYTVDGGALGEIEYENFNAAQANVHIRGKVIHPGYAKNKMKNAALIAARFESMLPPQETPAHTEGYEGFFHLQHIEGDVQGADLTYLIRDHDRNRFEERKGKMLEIAGELNRIYGKDTVGICLRDSYYNMKEKILPHMELIDKAREAMLEEGITPSVVPVRGGTDGARLSFMGLPCPNLCSGAMNPHGPYEYCSVQDLEKITAMLIRLVQKFTD